MFDSDSSKEEFTTHSEDERYATYLKSIQKRNQLKEHYREQHFQQILEEREHPIFNMQGINIMRFSHMRIKFCFQPSLLYEHISRKLIFYCSIKYLKKYKKWIIKREPIPARPLFYKVTSKSILINDSLPEIGGIIMKIYKELRKWSEEEIKYRRRKYENYCSGEISYIEIDSTDEELYFTADERLELFERRKSVLRRMIPPTLTKTKVSKQPKLKYQII